MRDTPPQILMVICPGQDLWGAGTPEVFFWFQHPRPIKYLLLLGHMNPGGNVTSSPAYPVRGQCVEPGRGGTCPFFWQFANDTCRESSERVQCDGLSQSLTSVALDTHRGHTKRKTGNASRGIARRTVLFFWQFVNSTHDTALKWATMLPP